MVSPDGVDGVAAGPEAYHRPLGRQGAGGHPDEDRGRRGIGPRFAAELIEAGVATTDALLDRGASAAGRDRLSATTGISEHQLLEWGNHADLMRIDGVGSEYADLLEAADVDSCAELARRNAANLATTFQELDAARPNVVRQVPSEATIAKWIEQADGLAKVVSH